MVPSARPGMVQAEAPTTPRGAGLVLDDVAGGVGDELHPALEVSHHRDQVALGPGGHEQRRLLVEQLGGALLQADRGGVVAEDVVADLRSAIARRISGVGW
jgi:hypothetical protein